MINEIVVFSRYAIRAPGFGVSMHEMIKLSLGELVISTRFVSEYADLKSIKNSTILFLIKPNSYLSHLKEIDESNRNIIWNLEPFSFRHMNDKKIDRFRGMYGKMIHNMPKYKLHHIFFFDKRQSDLFKNKNCSYLPIGFHPCMASKKRGYSKKHKKTILFLGKMERSRRSAFAHISKIIRTKGISLYRIDHGSFKNLKHNVDLIYSFRWGLNHHERDQILHTHWHRIMIYAANRVLLISQDDLSKFGFVNGEHYIYYTKMSEVAKIGFGNHIKFDKMTKAMLKKIKAEYNMKDLFEKSLGSIL